MAQGFDLRHLSRYAQAPVVSCSACAPCCPCSSPVAAFCSSSAAAPSAPPAAPAFPLAAPCCLPAVSFCCSCPASPLCPSAAPALSPAACSWLGGWSRRMDLGTKERARGASWSNWWHSENDCLCAAYLSALSPGVFCFAWLVLEAKNGVASVSGLYWPANGFLFSPNVLSLTME